MYTTRRKAIQKFGLVTLRTSEPSPAAYLVVDIPCLRTATKQLEQR